MECCSRDVVRYVVTFLGNILRCGRVMPDNCWDVSVQVPSPRHWRKVPSPANQEAIATGHFQSLSSPHPQSLPKLHTKSSSPTCEIGTDCNRLHGGILRQILRLTERGSTLQSSPAPTSAARSLAAVRRSARKHRSQHVARSSSTGTSTEAVFFQAIDGQRGA